MVVGTMMGGAGTSGGKVLNRQMSMGMVKSHHLRLASVYGKAAQISQEDELFRHRRASEQQVFWLQGSGLAGPGFTVWG